MNTYISEVIGVIEKWTADNAGTPPKEQDIKDAFAEGFVDAKGHGLIRSAEDGDGYIVANFGSVSDPSARTALAECLLE